MNIRTGFLFLTSAIGLSANPIVVNEGTTADKVSENCLIFVNQESMTVSCSVEYEMVTKAAPNIHIHVPVFCSTAQYQNMEQTKKLINAKIECEGRSYGPVSVFSSEVAVDAEGRPDFIFDASKVELGCEFLIKTPINDRFSILVTYTQPLIDGKAYYHPLFERELKSRDRSNFKITFFTASELKLNLVSQGGDKSEFRKRRFTINPRNSEIIAVEINKDEPATESR